MKNKIGQVLLAIVVAFSLFCGYEPVNAFADNSEQIVATQEERTATHRKVVGIIPASMIYRDFLANH